MGKLRGLVAIAGLYGCQEAGVSGVSADTDPPLRVAVLEVTPCPPPDGFDAARMLLLGVRVQVRGGHPRGVAANYFYGSVLTTDQSRYLAELPGCTPALSSKPLLPGESAEGFLNFPIPLGKSVETLVYAPPLPGAAEGEGAVEIALGAKHAPRAAEEEE